MNYKILSISSPKKELQTWSPHGSQVSMVMILGP